MAITRRTTLGSLLAAPALLRATGALRRHPHA